VLVPPEGPHGHIISNHLETSAEVIGLFASTRLLYLFLFLFINPSVLCLSNVGIFTDVISSQNAIGFSRNILLENKPALVPLFLIDGVLDIYSCHVVLVLNRGRREQ